MLGSTDKRGFVRTRRPALEQSLSWLLLAGLAAVGLAVYGAGQTYDAALFGLDASQLSTIGPARTEVALTAPAIGAPAGAAQVSRVEAALRAAIPSGWQPLSALERFTADNLYEKINGRAEQYLAYDVVGLTCLSLAPTGGAGEFIDVFVYDMGGIRRAFGIYSIERSPDEPVVDLGRGGYRSGASYFFWHGPYYIQIMASEVTDALATLGQSIGAKLVGQLVDSGEPVAGLDLLPRQGLVPGTEQFFMRDALSLDFLADTFVGQYGIAGSEGDLSEVTGFVSRLASPAAADSVLEKYRAYLADFGDVSVSEADGGRRLRGDLGGFYDVVFRRGAVVAGVTLVEDADLADRAAAGMWRELSARETQSAAGAAAGD